MLRIESEGNRIRFYATSAGYAVTGGSVGVAEVRVTAEVPVGNLYTELTTSQALGYFDNDWQAIYNAAVRQARVIPGSVWPPFLLSELNPNAPTPKVFYATIPPDLSNVTKD